MLIKKLTNKASQSEMFKSAQSFFSKDNPNHPQVTENMQLRQRLQKLKQMQSHAERVGTPADTEQSIRSLQQ
jgi:hypothetical protein